MNLGVVELVTATTVSLWVHTSYGCLWSILNLTNWIHRRLTLAISHTSISQSPISFHQKLISSKMQVSGYFGCKEKPWAMVVRKNLIHSICELNSLRLWGVYPEIWHWYVSLPQIRQEKAGCVMDYTFGHKYPYFLHGRGRGERRQLPHKETQTKEVYRTTGLFSSCQGESWQHGIKSPKRYVQSYLKYWLKRFIETYLVDLAWTVFWGKYLSGLHPWVFMVFYPLMSV